MKSFLKTALHTALLVLTISTTAFATEYIAKYRSSMGIMGLGTEQGGVQINVLDHHAAGQYYVVDINDSQKIPALVQLISNPEIEYVVPNAKMHAFSTPVQTTALKSQWAIDKVQATKAWQRAGNKGSRKVVVAVIDTGADYNHKNLAPNMVTGYDFINNNDKPMDIVGQNPGHGTHCSGIIGATGLVDGGTIGISPEVSIMPLRFLDQDGSGDLNNAVKAIDFAISKHVDVMSASWGAAVSRTEAQPLIDALTRAEKAGILFVVAASNDGQDNDSYEVYPTNAGTSNIISVAASSQDDSKPSWSNYGRTKVSLASPGDAITSTLPNNSYGDLSGTSMATPLVAGLVALVKAQDNSLTPVEIRSLLQATADKVSIPTACDCRVNAFAAVDGILAKKMFVSPYATTLAIGDHAQFEAVYGKAPIAFVSSSPNVGTVDASGRFTAIGSGQTIISVKDATGATASSYNIYVGSAASNQPAPPGPNQPPAPPSQPGQPGNPGQPGSCPLGNPQLCQALCQAAPTLPFCSGGSTPTPPPPNGGGKPGSCPLGNPQLCQALCQAAPTMPFCKGPAPEDTNPAPGTCPLGDPQLCQTLCQQSPSLPFCSGGTTPAPGPTPAPGTCPLGDPATCRTICQQAPTLPFCK